MDHSETWRGIRPTTRTLLQKRDYSQADIAAKLSGPGIPSGTALAEREALDDVWIPGVELFQRQVYQQQGRGYFSELTRTSEGILEKIGLCPKQWATALMNRDSAKGFHIHAPDIPEGRDPADWFRELYIDAPEAYERRPYDLEQWDVMFFLVGTCDMLLVDEREGMERRVMRFTIEGDNRPGPDNVGVVIPAGVAHALRSVGQEEIIMVYGTSTVFNPEWEGRIAAGVEASVLPDEWSEYIGTA